MEQVFNSLQMAFTQMLTETMAVLPTLVVALAVLLVGIIVASSLKALVVGFFKRLRINEALGSTILGRMVEKAGMQFNAGLFLGSLVKWFIVLVFLVVVLDMLGLTEVTTFLRDVVITYLPRVIIAALILMVAAIVAGVAQAAVVATARTASLKNPEMYGKLASTAVMVFAVLAALNQLQIATELVQTLFAGLVFAAALALGLAFGLGGRSTAERYLESMRSR